MNKEHDDPIWPRFEIANLISAIVNDLDFMEYVDCGEYVIKELECNGLVIGRVR